MADVVARALHEPGEDLIIDVRHTLVAPGRLVLQRSLERRAACIAHIVKNGLADVGLLEADPAHQRAARRTLQSLFRHDEGQLSRSLDRRPLEYPPVRDTQAAAARALAHQLME